MVDILPINLFLEPLNTNEEQKEKLKQSNFITYSVFLSKSEKDVQSLLILAGSIINWITLYAIYDTLKFYSQDFDNLTIRCGYDRNAIKAFTGTANNFGLLGINARHGEQGWGIPTQTMTLKEAKELILRLIKQYILEK